MLPLCVGGLMLAACGADATTLGGPADTSAQSSTAMPVTSPRIIAPTITGVDGPTAPLAVALVVLDAPGIAVLGAASTASEVVGTENAGRWASSRSFAPVASPHDDVDGPRVGIVVLAIAADEVAPVDTRSVQVDVDGRSMSVTDDENSLVVEASTPDGVRFGLAGLNVAEADLLALAADVIWTGERFSFTEGDVPAGWIDIGNTLSSMSFFPAASGSSTPVGGARLTYGDAELDTTRVTLTTWPIRGPDPVAEARYALDGEVELPIDVGGIGTTAFTGGGGGFFNFVIWNDGIQWMALSSPTRGIDELVSLVPSVRPATEQESAEILALAD